MRFLPIRRSLPLCMLAAALLPIASRAGNAALFSGNTAVPQWGLDAAKTKVPDYAKDASAVVLYEETVETVDGRGRATERERKAVRVLEPQGRNKAACGISFDVDEKINYFREWTIGADEKQYQAKDTDFADIGETNSSILLSTEKVRVVHVPAADPGATVICESEELLKPYIQEEVWEFQNSIPAVYQALEVDLPAGRPYTAAWHRAEPVQPTEVAPNHWRWEIEDEPKLDLRDVKASLEWSALAARMSVQWGDAVVAGTDNQWKALGAWVTKLEADRPAPSAEITAKTQELVAGTTDFYTKLSHITDYIQKNIRYFVVERGIGGLQAHPAADIFRNHYGDCKDKTTLLISMLQVAGINAFYVPVDDRRGVVDPDMPSIYGNHMITAIEIPANVEDARLEAVVKAKDGKRYLIFDPTNERTPVGNLPSYEQGSYGVLAAGSASQVMALPVLDPGSNGTEKTGTFTLEADGSLTGSVETLHTGPDGADLRMMLKYTDEKERHDYLERTLGHDIRGATLDSFEFVQPDELDKPIEFQYKVTAPDYAHVAGPLLLVRPRVVGDDSIAFDEKPRKLPIELEATGRWHDSFDITLPAGYIVDETPEPVDVKMDFADYHSSVTAKGNVLHYERELVVRQVELPAARAADFRKFEGAIGSDQQVAAVLKKQ